MLNRSITCALEINQYFLEISRKIGDSMLMKHDLLECGDIREQIRNVKTQRPNGPGGQTGKYLTIRLPRRDCFVVPISSGLLAMTKRRGLLQAIGNGVHNHVNEYTGLQGVV